MPTSLSYREKSLYASLAAELIVYVPYCFLNRANNSLTKVTGMIFAIIVLQILLQSVIAAFTRNRVTDERDRLLELRGYRVGYLTATSLMVLNLGMLWLYANLGGPRLDSHILARHFLNLFLGVLVLSDISKTLTQIVAYRKAL